MATAGVDRMPAAIISLKSDTFIISLKSDTFCTVISPPLAAAISLIRCSVSVHLAQPGPNILISMICLLSVRSVLHLRNGTGAKRS